AQRQVGRPRWGDGVQPAGQAACFHQVAGALRQSLLWRTEEQSTLHDSMPLALRVLRGSARCHLVGHENPLHSFINEQAATKNIRRYQGASPMEHTIEQRTIRKVSWRLLPLIVVIYFIAYMDRTNVSFASLSMNKDLGFSAYIYGWGAGIFFLGYFLFEVPSNVILEKTGARIWIARIMITWGIAAAVMALVTGPVSFLTLRFLLGVAEAGFFPGMILYFTYWFPSQYRARVISALFIAVPGANALTAIISGAVLEMDGLLGLRGWQWVFIVEAVPAVLLAFAVLALMTDRPA